MHNLLPTSHNSIVFFLTLTIPEEPLVAALPSFIENVDEMRSTRTEEEVECSTDLAEVGTTASSEWTDGSEETTASSEGTDGSEETTASSEGTDGSEETTASSEGTDGSEETTVSSEGTDVSEGTTASSEGTDGSRGGVRSTGPRGGVESTGSTAAGSGGSTGVPKSEET